MEADAPEPTAAAAPPRSDTPLRSETPPRSDRKPIHWLLEGLFIVVSVMLGFAVTRYGEYRDERELAARMLASVRAEVEFNRATLERYVPIHRVWRQALEREDPAAGSASAIDVFFANRPELPPDLKSNVPMLRTAAWDTALSTGALRLIDYDLAAALSEIYGMQEYAGSVFLRLFSEPRFYDPGGRSATIRFAQVTMSEMTWAEETLLGLYDKHLPAIRTGGQ